MRRRCSSSPFTRPTRRTSNADRCATRSPTTWPDPCRRQAADRLRWRHMMSLPTRTLGTTGLEITTVGFGSWAAGGGGWSFGWGPQDDSLSIAAIHRAVDLGVSWIDTAAIYGLGLSLIHISEPTRLGMISYAV